jgi:predicted aconitase
MSIDLAPDQQALLDGRSGPATQKAMQILRALGEIYGARRMTPIASAQISGVSYDNLGDAGLEWLAEMAAGGARVRVPAMLNPAGMDLENWPALGIPPAFAEKQTRVIAAFKRMGVTVTCTCTPYLAGTIPERGQSIAWAESSAVCYANSILGARTNREGGPSALAAAIAGCTPEYGLHLDENRKPGITVHVHARLEDTADFGALGKAMGERLEASGVKRIPWITGVPSASVEQMKAFCASVATYGGLAMFLMQGISPEADGTEPPACYFEITDADVATARASLQEATREEVDFVSLGCPHLSLAEVARVAGLVRGRSAAKEFWLTMSRPVKREADAAGYTAVLEAAGVKMAVDTCCVVAPIRGRFHALATDSAKACYYAYSKNRFKTRLLNFDEVIEEALA